MKMEQLWLDLLRHVYIHTQTATSSSILRRFFLGTVVVDQQTATTGSGNIQYLVDGQQRFTTLSVIAAALRDALISTGHTDIAGILDNDIITEHYQINDEKLANRFELLDIPAGAANSSEMGMKGYRKRLCPITLDMVTKESKKGTKVLCVKGSKPNAKIPWSVSENKTWKLLVGGNIELVVASGTGNGLKKDDNVPDQFELLDELQSDIGEDLEIVLLPDVLWPNQSYNLKFPDGTEATKSRILNDEKKCDLYEKRRREFYFHVRRMAEHYILGEKKYVTLDKSIPSDQINIQLKLEQDAHVSQIGWLGRVPTPGEEVIFEKQVPMAPEDIPDESELKEIIKNQMAVKGHEGNTLELKATLRVNLSRCWKHKNSGDEIGMEEWNKIRGKLKKAEYEKITKDPVEGNQNTTFKCIKTISALMNTFGGALIVGVKDNGEIKGIEVDGFRKKGKPQFSADVAEMFLSQKVEFALGVPAAQLIKTRVIMVDNKPILYVHVPKWKFPQEPPLCKVDGSNEEKFYARIGSRSIPLSGKKKDEHIEAHFGPDPPKPELESVSRTFTLEACYQNSGEPKLKGEIKGDSDIPPLSTCTIKYIPEGEWPDHLAEPKKRARQLSKLVTQVLFSRIHFIEEPASAIDHFMKTNDKATMENLTAYDMASAFTQKIIRPKVGGQKNLHQIAIEKSWDEFSQRVYISTNKDPATAKTFFYYFLMASGRWKTDSARWQSAEAWSGMLAEIDKHTNMDGSYEYVGLSELYDEMNRYSEPFSAAWNPDSFDSDKDPFNKAEFRDVRTYLKILGKPKMRQHIPVYMAIFAGGSNIDFVERCKIAKGFLKNWIYIFLRYRVIHNLHKGVSSGFTNGDFYGMIDGKTGWINDIHEMFSTLSSSGSSFSDEDITKLTSLPLDLEDKQGLGKHHPWEIDHPYWKELGVDHAKKKNQVEVLLYAYERASEGKTNPTMGRLHPPSKPQVEHILPEDPKLWAGRWYRKKGGKTRTWEKWAYALGNHVLLEDSKNSHVSNLRFEKKIPQDGCGPCPTGKKTNHYEGTNYNSAKNIISHFNGGNKKWLPKDGIEKHSTEIMNTIVKFFDGK